MNCEDVRAWLRRDLDGAAEPSADAAEHLERCGACREEASRLKGIAAAGRDALPAADRRAFLALVVEARPFDSLGRRAVDAAKRARATWLALLEAEVQPGEVG